MPLTTVARTSLSVIIIRSVWVNQALKVARSRFGSLCFSICSINVVRKCFALLQDVLCSFVLFYVDSSCHVVFRWFQVGFSSVLGSCSVLKFVPRCLNMFGLFGLL